MGKILSRGLLVLYLLILIWLVLFKFSFNISAVLDHQRRSLNLIPFAAPSLVNGAVNFGEIIDNCIVFIPFGLLLSVNFKKIGFFHKLAYIAVFSLAAESIQFIFAIGATDITDLITNTFGGFLGLKLYGLGNKYINNEKLDKVIISIGTLLLVLFISMVAIQIGRRLGWFKFG
jgi:glycopeptide antibiotics resistance protein